ncbi:MAG: YihA family ribosome biogenesis GTP-binding protein [Calditrichae bacterium]|nr:YihA family ribosome biogenesis GTP-binding protein [Calditrichia bacterium]
MRIPKVSFVKSVADIRDLPAIKLPEIALVGRSNVGKSSMINSLFNQRHLAKTSSTPGKTRLINYFLVDETFYLVDLPGYGYTKISNKITRTWEKMVTGYLVDNPNLKWVFLLIDSRHELMNLDRQMINWLTEIGIPFVAVLTKCDKISKNRLAVRLKQIELELAVISILPYSAKLHQGRDKAHEMFTNLTINV